MFLETFKPVSLMMGPPAFLLQPSFNWLAALCSKYWFYDIDAKSFHNFFLFVGYFLIILVPFEISVPISLKRTFN